MDEPGQSDSWKVQTPEKENIVEGKGKLYFESNPVVLRAPTSPKLHSSHHSPRLPLQRSLSCSSKLSNNAAEFDAKNFCIGTRSPGFKRAVVDDLRSSGQQDLQADNWSSKEGKMLKKRSLDIPLPTPLHEWPEIEIQGADQKGLGLESEFDGNDESLEKTGFSDIRNHLSLPVSQPKGYLSVDHVPFQSRSTGNIREACAEELRLEYENAAVENSKAQDINLPHEIRRISDKDRASSMPKLLEYSEEKTFANITAFNLAAQQPADSRTAVRFREITEPVKKSKWFHALYTVVSLDYFKTAMMEIQKQREEEKTLEENRPSMATTFEEIKQCRYLRIPDHYQKKDG